MSLLESGPHKGSKRIRQALLGLLVCAVILALVPLFPTEAHAVTSAEKQAEADEMVRQLDVLQTEIEQVTQDLRDAEAAQAFAYQLMREAQDLEDQALARTTEIQKQLSDRAVESYRNGTPSYLDVLFGANSFSEFLTSWNMIERLNDYDVKLARDSKLSRAQAEGAHQVYAEQELISTEKLHEIEELKAQLDKKSEDMRVEIAALNEEAAELLAKEEAEAEAARLAALAAANTQLTPAQIEGFPHFMHPCPGAVISSSFGWRDFDSSFHMGLDLAAGEGTPIYAAVGGTVIISGYSSSAGNWVVISHGGGLVTKYMHASALYVTAGETVSAGDQIAAVGNTGNSFGAHLHFQVEVYGSAIDPYPFLY